MSSIEQALKENWEDSFEEQISRSAYNTAPCEAVVRSAAYYLRDVRPDGDYGGLHFCEIGCGAGPTLLWLAQKGINVSGVDIAPSALELARKLLSRNGFEEQIGDLVEASVADVPLPDESFDGILESCTLAHLPREDREAAFREVDRLTKPGGLFVANLIEQKHTVFQTHEDEQLEDDPGTLMLDDGGSKLFLTNIGPSHFFTAEEVKQLLPGWSVVDPCVSQYELPQSEADKRGYEGRYLQSMMVVYAIK